VPGKDLALLSSPANPYPQDGQSFLETRVFDINNNGWSVGTIDQPRAPGVRGVVRDGVVWSPENTFTVIGPYIKPMQINDAGMVVGFRSFARQSTRTEAVIWDREGGIRELNKLVPAGSRLLGAAVAINNKGEIVCMAANMKDWYLLRPVDAKS
jgi:hypothetical protein